MPVVTPRPFAVSDGGVASPRLRLRNVARFTMSFAALCAYAATASAQSREQRDAAFSWSGAVEVGRSVIIRNINGPIRVEHSSGSRVEVTAEKQWRDRQGDPADVRIVQPAVRNGDAMFCALWSPESTCDEDGIHTTHNGARNNRRHDVSVNWVVRVPDGVRVDIGTVNGGLDVIGVTAAIEANTVNGAIDARTSGGPIRAKTVNGRVNVVMGSTGAGGGDLEYESVNGSVTVELPSNFGAHVELSTVNGQVTTDFPITVVGTVSRRRLSGSVGSGSTRLRASTVNGSVTLRRGR
jgi:hypothetical protein